MVGWVRLGLTQLKNLQFWVNFSNEIRIGDVTYGKNVISSNYPPEIIWIQSWNHQNKFYNFLDYCIFELCHFCSSDRGTIISSLDARTLSTAFTIKTKRRVIRRRPTCVTPWKKTAYRMPIHGGKRKRNKRECTQRCVPIRHYNGNNNNNTYCMYIMYGYTCKQINKYAKKPENTNAGALPETEKHWINL